MKQFRHSHRIAALISAELLTPESPVRFRHDGILAAWMLVPEAAMNEDGLLGLGENEVGCSGKMASMQAISDSKTPYNAPDGQFGFGVLPTNPAHVLAAPLG